jgi:hypothetical protein
MEAIDRINTQKLRLSMTALHTSAPVNARNGIFSGAMTEHFFAAKGTIDIKVKGIIDKKDAGHFEPEDIWLPWKTYNPLIPQFTAAWFKLHVENKKSEFGIDFEAMLYGNGTNSICGGDDGGMSKCDIRD